MPTIDDQEATLALTRELIARRSVTPDDAGCQDSMMARLEQVGFSVESMRFGEVDNFWATRGTSGPLLIFAGHTDVVPPVTTPAGISTHLPPPSMGMISSDVAQRI